MVLLMYLLCFVLRSTSAKRNTKDTVPLIGVRGEAPAKRNHPCVTPALAALASTVTCTVNVCTGATSGSNERLYTSISVVEPPAAAVKRKTCAPPAPGGASAG